MELGHCTRHRLRADPTPAVFRPNTTWWARRFDYLAIRSRVRPFRSVSGPFLELTW